MNIHWLQNTLLIFQNILKTFYFQNLIDFWIFGNLFFFIFKDLNLILSKMFWFSDASLPNFWACLDICRDSLSSVISKLIMFYRGLFNLLWFEDFGWKTCWIDGCLKGNQHRFLFTNTQIFCYRFIENFCPVRNIFYSSLGST